MDGSFSCDERLLINSRIFSEAQVKSIKNIRQQYESKVERKDKQIFFSYIESEKKILQKIQQHIKKKGDPLTQQMILRIIHIHNRALSYFETELKFWISFIKFCIESNHPEFISKSKIKKMLEIFKNDENVWLLAAKFESNKFDVNQIENGKVALNYLYKGLHHNPESTVLFLQILKYVLSKTEDDKNMIENEAVELFKKSTKILTNSLEQSEVTVENDLKESYLKFYIEFLKIATEFDFTKKLQFLVCQFLKENFSRTIDVWHLLSNRELEGHHFSENYSEVQKIDDPKLRIENCLKFYEKAIQILPIENMWGKYLDTLMDLHETYAKSNPNITDNFIKACNEAHKNGLMNEKHYILWLKCLKDNEQVSEILETATKKKPNSIRLWNARIDYHFNKKEFKIINKIFDEAIKTLGDNSAFMWKRKIQYYQLIHQMIQKNGKLFTFAESKITLQNDRIKNIFMEGIKYSDNVSKELQPLFLEWMSLTHSREQVIELYRNLTKLDKFCLELHKQMAAIESITSNPSQEIFDEIKKNLENHPEEFKQFEEYILQEIHYGPSWKSTVYKKYLFPNS